MSESQYRERLLRIMDNYKRGLITENEAYEQATLLFADFAELWAG